MVIFSPLFQRTKTRELITCTRSYGDGPPPRRWKGPPVGPDDFVLSTNEKPSVQARPPVPSLAARRPNQPMRVDHERICPRLFARPRRARRARRGRRRRRPESSPSNDPWHQVMI
jgi:hypothetical protein